MNVLRNRAASGPSFFQLSRPSEDRYSKRFFQILAITGAILLSFENEMEDHLSTFIG